jgi:hypothetical protein
MRVNAEEHVLGKSGVLQPLHLRPRIGNLLLADAGIVQEIEIDVIQTKLSECPFNFIGKAER